MSIAHDEARIEELTRQFVAGELLLSENLEVRSDPHPLYHRLRAGWPVMHTPTDELFLTRWADCEQVLRDPRFSSNPTHLETSIPIEERSFREQITGGEVNTLLFMDPPDHTRIRQLVSKAFTPRTVERLRPRITEICDTILDEAAERGSLDVVSDLGYVLPVTVICEMLGVPVEDRDQFGPWSSDASRLLDNFIDDATMQRGVLAFMMLLNYLNGLFEERRKHPGDDLISALLAAEDAGDRLSEEELRSIVILLFIAGHETTMNLIGNGTWALLQHPDQLDRLRADPTLIGTCVEELLRYDGPVHITGRIATCPLDVAGIPVRKGQPVVTLVAAANRDPAQFPDPDRLDIGRTDNRHLTFSHGMHYCLGAALARAEGQVAISTLASRFPRLEALETPTYRDHFVLRRAQLAEGVGGVNHALVLHHDANSTAGLVGRHLESRGWTLTDHFLCDDPRSPIPSRPLPDPDELDDVDLLVLTGSQWSVYDDDSIGGWIHDELSLIRHADALGIAVFGMCFGAQALASAFGGRTELAPVAEVGWHEVTTDQPEIGSGPWFQWHFDRFDPPPGATVLAHSPAAIQAFRLRRNLGLQFHPELDDELLALWVSSDHDELRAAGIEPDALTERTRREVGRATLATGRLSTGSSTRSQ